jgi:hypothetical protein
MTNNTTPAELLLLLLSDGATDGNWRNAGRQGEPAQVGAMRERLKKLAQPEPEHFDEIALSELADAAHGSDISDARLAHLATCQHCRLELGSIAALMRDPQVSFELHRQRQLTLVAAPPSRVSAAALPSLRRRSLHIVAGAVAAAAVLLLGIRLVTPKMPTTGLSRAFRHASIEVADAPKLRAPVGEVGEKQTLVWTSVAKADLYRVTIFDASGRTVYEAEVPDTVVAWSPDSLTHWTGELRWRVKARTSADRWVDSDFGTLSTERAK